MTDIFEIQVPWTGVRGLPGVSTFFAQGADPAAALGALSTFFHAVVDLHPTGVVWAIPRTGKIITLETGMVSGVWTQPGSPELIGADGPTLWASPVGWVVTWHTGTYTGGRELKGRTFMVPCCSSMFDSDGSINSSRLANMQTACNAVATGLHLSVYSRTQHAVGTIHSGVVPDMGAVLRSRRP